MATPDPNYWGNPPETPRSKYDPRNQQPNTAPQQPYAAPASQPQAQAPTDQAPYNADQAPYNTSQAPYNPAPQPKKKGKTVAIVVGIIAVVVLFFGIAGCVAVNTISNLENQYEQSLPFSTDSTQPDSGNSGSTLDSATLNEYTRNKFGLTGSSAITTDELNQIQSDYFANASKSADENGHYGKGVYVVGTDIEPGTYWFYGSESTLSYFYVLESASEEGTYNATVLNNYYGHNLIDLEEGEVLILDNSEGMVNIDQLNETFSSPYGSGVYRVGTDIPAGTYTLGYGEADDYSAYYIMSDLDYESSSYLATNYFVSGDSLGTITLEEGTYVELYNLTLTSNTA